MGYQVPVSEFQKRHLGREVIGDTLFIDGTPYIECAICGQVSKKFDGNLHVAVSGGKKQKQIITYKVTVGFWKREIEAAIVGTQQELREKLIPVLSQHPACAKCWQIQQDQKAHNGGKLTFFKISDLFHKKDKQP